MTRTTLSELKEQRLAAMSVEQRKEFDETYAVTYLALTVGDQIRDAREAAGLSQRDLAKLMSTSQAAIGRLEAGSVGATLTTIQKVGVALGLTVTFELTSTS